MLKQPEVSHLICQLRQLTAVSQEQLAYSLGVAYCTVNRWENGHIQPSPLALKQIKRLLETLENNPERKLQEGSRRLLQQYFPDVESGVR